MNNIKLALGAMLVAVSTLGVAAETASVETREQRMDAALQQYHDTANNPQPGPAARAERSVKREFHEAGHAIRHGSREAGHAVRRGAQKTRHAVHRAGEKVEGSDSSK